MDRRKSLKLGSVIDCYSKARKYVDISGGTNPTPPLARFLTSPIHDVQVIVDFTINTSYKGCRPSTKFAERRRLIMRYVLRNTLTLLLGVFILVANSCLLTTGTSGVDRTTMASAKRPTRLSNGAKPRTSDGVCRFPVPPPLPLLSGKIKFSSPLLKATHLF